MKTNMKKISFWLFALIAGVSMTAMVACSKDDDGNTDDTDTGKIDPSTIAAGNLVAYFPFEDAVNPTIGTGITYESKGSTASFVTGLRGKAYKGAEANGHLVFNVASDNKLKAMKEYTVAFWMKAPKIGGGQAVFQLNGGDANMGSLAFIKENWTSETSDSLTLKPYLFNTTTTWKGQDLGKANPAFAADRWIHIVTLYNSTTSSMQLYANGKLIAESIRYGAPDPNNDDDHSDQPKLGQLTLDQTSDKLYFGDWGKKITNTSPETWMSAYDGLLDEFRIYDKALTEAEIADLYKAEVLNMNE
jgi:hypothetical protein